MVSKLEQKPEESPLKTVIPSLTSPTPVLTISVVYGERDLFSSLSRSVLRDGSEFTGRRVSDVDRQLELTANVQAIKIRHPDGISSAFLHMLG